MRSATGVMQVDLITPSRHHLLSRVQDDCQAERMVTGYPCSEIDVESSKMILLKIQCFYRDVCSSSSSDKAEYAICCAMSPPSRDWQEATLEADKLEIADWPNATRCLGLSR